MFANLVMMSVLALAIQETTLADPVLHDDRGPQDMTAEKAARLAEDAARAADLAAAEAAAAASEAETARVCEALDHFVAGASSSLFPADPEKWSKLIMETQARTARICRGVQRSSP